MTTLHTPPHRYVTRTVHSVQHQLVQIHPIHRTRVDRLHSTAHHRPTAPNCDLAQNSDRSNVPFSGRFFSKCPLVMCSYRRKRTLLLHPAAASGSAQAERRTHRDDESSESLGILPSHTSLDPTSMSPHSSRRNVPRHPPVSTTMVIHTTKDHPTLTSHNYHYDFPDPRGPVTQRNG